MKLTALRNSYGYDTLYGRYGDYYYNGRRAQKNYSKQFIYEKNFEAILSLFSSSEFSSVSCAEKPILVQGLSFGCTGLRTMLKKGFPALSETWHHGLLKHQVKVYRSRLGKCSLQTNLHFINGKLLYAHLCFTRADKSLQQSIFESLEEKYQCRLSPTQSFVVKDPFGNCIKGTCGQEMNLYYLSGDQQQLQVIKDEQSRRKFIKDSTVSKIINKLREAV